ncbi:MAG: DUF3185 domain-containing protein [Verrucomicrobiota bacterium]|nr:DUF3185 domain-containing protein [Verrucomicrobiota bacterium]
MNSKIIIGIVLIGLGIISLGYQAITYTKREKVVDMGPIQITSDTEKKIPLSPIIGAILVVGGVVVIVSRKA